MNRRDFLASLVALPAGLVAAAKAACLCRPTLPDDALQASRKKPSGECWTSRPGYRVVAVGDTRFNHISGKPIMEWFNGTEFVRLIHDE